MSNKEEEEEEEEEEEKKKKKKKKLEPISLECLHALKISLQDPGFYINHWQYVWLL